MENSLPCVKRRPRNHLRKKLQASSFLLYIIKSGCVLPLKSEPTPIVQNSIMQNSKFVQECIADLLVAGFIKEVLDTTYVCSPLSVVENSLGSAT